MILFLPRQAFLLVAHFYERETEEESFIIYFLFLEKLKKREFKEREKFQNFVKRKKEKKRI